MEFDWNELLNTIGTLVTTWGLKVIGVLVIVFVSWVIAGWSRRSLQRALEKRKFDATLTRFFANLLRYAILIAAGVGAMGIFGIETTSFAALIAAMGLAIGLAFQGTLSNFASGVMLLIFRPYKVGDLVQLGGVLGFVEELELFTTEIKSLDNRRYTVPNSAIFGSTIENLTHYPVRRVDVPVGCEYSADIDQCREVFEKMAPDIPGVLQDPPPQIFLAELGGSSVDWQVRVWCNTPEYWDVYQATIRDAKRSLEAAGIGIPFPQVDVHFDGPVVQALADKKSA
jgi:small conductance mechanosensitive channel